MTPSLATLALCLAVPSAAPAPSALDQVLKLLGQKKCDDAFELVAKAEVPSPPTPASLKSAKAVARGAEACRESDPVVALSFSALAAKLAPSDDEVAVTHAQGLVAVKQEADAAAALAAIVAAQPARKAPKAWMLRARLVHESGDFEEAVRLFTGLAAEPATRKEAEPLLALAREGLEKSREVRYPPRRPDATEKPVVEPEPAVRRHESGQVAASFPGQQVGLGGSTTLKARLVKGRTYVFKATGRCDRSLREFVDENPESPGFGNTIRVKPVDTRGPVFGLDFRVQFGSQASRSLGVDVGADDESKVEFVADADDQVIRVFDESNAAKEVTCTVGGFSVVAR